jgi:ribonuclease P protein component
LYSIVFFVLLVLFVANLYLFVAKKFTLGKNERLKSRKAIEQLFKEGKRFTVPPFRVFYTTTADKCLLLGVGASTKNFKKAVDRNRIKRLIRESWRLQKNELGEIANRQNTGLHVFIIYTERELPACKQVFEPVGRAIQKLVKLIEV